MTTGPRELTAAELRRMAAAVERFRVEVEEIAEQQDAEKRAGLLEIADEVVGAFDAAVSGAPVRPPGEPRLEVVR